MDANNPLELTTKYTWQRGDTLMIVAWKYRRPGQWLEMLDLNKTFISNNGYILREGDILDVPEDWFPLPNPSFETKLKGSSGYRVNQELV